MLSALDDKEDDENFSEAGYRMESILKSAFPIPSFSGVFSISGDDDSGIVHQEDSYLFFAGRISFFVVRFSRLGNHPSRSFELG